MKFIQTDMKDLLWSKRLRKCKIKCVFFEYDEYLENGEGSIKKKKDTFQNKPSEFGELITK